MYIANTKPLRSRFESAIKEQITRRKAVTPKEYCDKWVTKRSGLQPDEWGYASACVRELASALGNDPNYATTITNALALKANIADTYSVTQLGANLDTTDFELVFTTALA
jgi:hypothetical protein